MLKERIKRKLSADMALHVYRMFTGEDPIDSVVGISIMSQFTRPRHGESFTEWLARCGIQIE